MNSDKILKYLSLNDKIELIGSNQNKKIKYKTDYDAQEYIGDLTEEEIYKKFKYIFNNKPDNVYITDFKSGVYKTVALRWKKKDIIKGYKMIDDNIKIEFINTLNDLPLNMIKIDLIVYHNKDFHEFSCNYYISKNIKDDEEIMNSLLIDVKEYYLKGKMMKALKRLYSYNVIIENKQNVNELIDIFNSKAGYLYKYLHKVNLILDAIKFKLPKDQCENVISTLRVKIPNKYKEHVNKKDLKKLVKILNNDINEIINVEI